MRLNNTPPPKKTQQQDSLLATPPFQTDLRWDSCICFLREVSALFGVHSIVDDPVRKSQGTNESTKKPEGPEGFKCEGFKWIFRYHNIYIYINIPKDLGPFKLKGLNPYNRGVLVLKMTPVFEGPMILLRDSNILMFFTWGVLGSWSGLDNSD